MRWGTEWLLGSAINAEPASLSSSSIKGFRSPGVKISGSLLSPSFPNMGISKKSLDFSLVEYYLLKQSSPFLLSTAGKYQTPVDRSGKSCYPLWFDHTLLLSYSLWVWETRMVSTKKSSGPFWGHYDPFNALPLFLLIPCLFMSDAHSFSTELDLNQTFIWSNSVTS